MKTRNKVLGAVLDGISPDVAYALGKCGGSCLQVKEAAARLLQEEGLTREVYGDRSWVHLDTLGGMLTEAFEERISANYPAAKEEPDPPAPPTSEAVELPATPVSSCSSCSKPDVVGLCADCKPLPVDVHPPGVDEVPF